MVRQGSKKGLRIFKGKTDATSVQTTALPKGRDYYWYVKSCRNNFGCSKSLWQMFTIK
jgi:hypothetical protein